ncbi:hypothetical protein PU629_08570 [Pullulanibacillus sp. KACC 23026]|uniref:hypothetical protein n=1 Tax=Pullulanibacillus sp. KACC 23026 TaxID=3028315 RepID=UPI0023B15B75|nr:hypothetical protein [Pullulanibacillus sp. KACC 23026]WEG14394.1 hypothetical protein PU629_08570 [Pullulanibacillus sp. KACC 23026]
MIIKSLAEDAQLREAIHDLHQVGWETFMRRDKIGNRYWDFLLQHFSQHQIVVTNEETGEPMATGNSLLLHWDGTLEDLPEGWDDAILRSYEAIQKGHVLNTICALAVVINPKFRRLGLSERVLSEMKKKAEVHGVERFIVPVRPSKKAQHPYVSMEDYIHWKTEKGEPYDPWLKVHCKIGGKILTICHQSMYIDGTIEEWEQWTNLKLTQQTECLIPTGLVPLKIEHEHDYAYYVEPNVWVEHPLTLSQKAIKV